MIFSICFLNDCFSQLNLLNLSSSGTKQYLWYYYREDQNQDQEDQDHIMAALKSQVKIRKRMHVFSAETRILIERAIQCTCKKHGGIPMLLARQTELPFMRQIIHEFFFPSWILYV